MPAPSGSRHAAVLTDTTIPPTSNRDEPARHAKTQQKISGRLRSETTTRHRYAIHRRQARNRRFHRHYDSLAENTWVPPIPATA